MSQPPVPRIELSKRESVDSELTRKLLEYLLSGAVAQGERLPSERTLATMIGVNRESIRNAIGSLAMLGIVETRMGSGTYFVGRQSAMLPHVIEWGLLLSQSWVMDLIEARYHLEILFAGLAAERRTEDDLEELRRSLVKMSDAQDNYADYAEADADFHLTLAKISGNVVLAGVLGNIRSLLSAWSERIIRAAGETLTSLPKHEAIFDAVADGAPDAARAAMVEHMDRSLKRLRHSVEDDLPGASTSQENH